MKVIDWIRRNAQPLSTIESQVIIMPTGEQAQRDIADMVRDVLASLPIESFPENKYDFLESKGGEHLEKISTKIKMSVEELRHGSNPGENDPRTEFEALRDLDQWLVQEGIDENRSKDAIGRIDRFYRGQVQRLVGIEAQVGIAAARREDSPADVWLHLLLPAGFDRTEREDSERLNRLGHEFETAAGFILLPHLSTHLDYLPYDRRKGATPDAAAREMAENDGAQFFGMLTL